MGPLLDKCYQQVTVHEITSFRALIQLFFILGHKIGEPSPLVKEIKADEIVSLKQRFAGRQVS
jgi:hypothetical protein